LLVQFLIELVGTLRNANQLELVLKFESKDLLLAVVSAKETPPAKRLSCLEVGDVVITRLLSLSEY
jgi:hypothetical protein